MNRWLPISIVCLTFGMTLTVCAQETLLMPVPVRPIYPGQILDEAEFTMKLFTVPNSSRAVYAFEMQQISSKEAVRTLAEGKPVNLRAIRAIEDVKKGQPTKAVYTSESIEIQGMLVPLTGGSVGQVVEARNAASGGIVKALVIGGGTLLVTGK